MIIVAVVALAVIGVGIYAVHRAAAKAMPKQALIGLTAAGALVLLPYAIYEDADVGVAIDPATGEMVTTFDGFGYDPLNERAVVAPAEGGLGVDVSNGRAVLNVNLIEGEEYKAPHLRGKLRKRLEAAGIESREERIEAPEGFRGRRVKALVIEPAAGETRRETLRRVERVLEEHQVETEPLRGAADRLRF